MYPSFLGDAPRNDNSPLAITTLLCLADEEEKEAADCRTKDEITVRGYTASQIERQALQDAHLWKSHIRVGSVHIATMGLPQQAIQPCLLVASREGRYS